MADQWAIIWDMDGVIVDTREMHYESWVAVLSQYQVNFSKENFLSKFGMNNQATIHSLMSNPPQKIVDEISHKKEAYFRQNIPGNARLLPGVQSWLQHFKDWGFLQGIASSAPQANITALVKENEIGVYFDALESAELLPSKPDPTIFLKVSGILKTPPWRCLVIEDAPAGIAGAHRGGMKCIAVTNTHPASELSTADLIIESLDLLTPQAVQQLLGIQ